MVPLLGVDDVGVGWGHGGDGFGDWVLYLRWRLLRFDASRSSMSNSEDLLFLTRNCTPVSSLQMDDDPEMTRPCGEAKREKTVILSHFTMGTPLQWNPRRYPFLVARKSRDADGGTIVP